MQVYMKDIILAVVFFIYPFVLLVASKMLDRTGVRKDLSRKLVHVGMGLVILFIPFFDHKWIALVPPIIFTVINAIDYKWGIFSQIQGEDQGNVGTILYPISFIVLISIFYGTAWWGLAVLGIFAMAFGDAGASIIGREFGKLKYYIAGETRSYAGSFAMLILTFAVAVIVFYFYGANMGMVIRFRTILAASFF
ncbi:MAG: hypothetical protein ABIC40_08590, partial [bacterium]